ncbi:hypothetical protein WAJ69_19740, partial [Acinetobacter baumannii]
PAESARFATDHFLSSIESVALWPFGSQAGSEQSASTASAPPQARATNAGQPPGHSGSRCYQAPAL